jgi:hypothetical protein
MNNSSLIVAFSNAMEEGDMPQGHNTSIILVTQMPMFFFFFFFFFGGVFVCTGYMNEMIFKPIVLLLLLLLFLILIPEYMSILIIVLCICKNNPY